MAATVTTLEAPRVVGGAMQATYSILLDTVYPTGGEVIDISGDFSTVNSAVVGGVDALADSGFVFSVRYPSAGTAVTSSNVLVVARLGGTTDVVLEEATGSDLSGVGELKVTIRGKGAITASWA